MLSRKFRFHSRGGVRSTYQNGKTIRDPKISLVFAVNTRKKQRFAVVVSKKVLKSAVGRNRIRRRVYEAIRLEHPRIEQPYDCIFVVYNKEILKMPFKELRSLISSLLKEANIILSNYYVWNSRCINRPPACKYHVLDLQLGGRFWSSHYYLYHSRQIRRLATYEAPTSPDSRHARNSARTRRD